MSDFVEVKSVECFQDEFPEKVRATEFEYADRNNSHNSK
jgi:hypothetical protein